MLHLQKRAARIAAIEDNMLLSVNKVWSPELASDVKHLWDDEIIKKSFKRRNEFQIGDSAEYYFNDMDRINTPDYVPTVQDALRTRLKTTGIVETTIKFGDFTVKVIDVGGQRNERKKWVCINTQKREENHGLLTLTFYLQNTDSLL